jgi:predicted TIM-barrel fold metal-dependent hydrolase
MIIDTHTHLGDLLYGKDIIFKQNIVSHKSDKELRIWELNDFVADGLFDDMDEQTFLDHMRNGDHARNECATLQNMQRSLNNNNIDKAWVLPVLPNVCFESILAASKLDDRIVPFTSIDYYLSPEQAAEKVINDVRNGAMGLKVHPVLQRKKIHNETLLTVLEEWRKVCKPVIFHTAEYEYFFEDESFRDRADYSNNNEFIQLAKEFPTIPMVAAHGGGPTTHEQILPAAKLDNVYVDLSFQPLVAIKDVIRAFGEDKILFGSDWPWGSQDIPLKLMMEATKNNLDAREKIFFKNPTELVK